MDPRTVAKVNGGILAAFAVMSLKDIFPFVPLVDVTGRFHKSVASHCWGYADKKLDEVEKKEQLWVTYGVAWIACTNFFMAAKASPELMKDANKLLLAFNALAVLLAIKNQMPWQGGSMIGGVASCIMGILALNK